MRHMPRSWLREWLRVVSVCVWVGGGYAGESEWQGVTALAGMDA
jgi:hypothetical protein